MLMNDALLRHFRKGMYHSGDRRLHTLISYVLLLPLIIVYMTCKFCHCVPVELSVTLTGGRGNDDTLSQNVNGECG